MAKQIKDISKKKCILRINVMISARECVTCHVHVSHPVVGGNWFLTQFKKTWMTVFTCTVWVLSWFWSYSRYNAQMKPEKPYSLFFWRYRYHSSRIQVFDSECRSGFWRLIIKFSPCSHCYCFLLLAVISERGKKLASVELVHYTV